MKNPRLIIGSFAVVIALAIVLFVVYRNSRIGQTTRPFSSYTVLVSAWEAYKKQFINADGRVIDASQQSITTSEGQSYALMRSVFTDDRQTFDQVWQWTQRNLQKRQTDKLFGWRWGELPGGGYGLLSDGGNNSAADADVDIALSLILASNRWGDDAYRQAAIPILADIWQYETAQANGQRYLLAGNWAQNANEIVVNPSYFAPYAYKIFADVDTEHDWKSLVDPAYQLLIAAGNAPLDTSKGVGLPPDWVTINRATGSLKPTGLPNLTTDYSYDAIRVPFRIALDYYWFADQRAFDYLSRSYTTLAEFYTATGKLPTSFAHDGTPKNQTESPSMYATSLGYFTVVAPDLAQAIYQDKIIKLYSNQENAFLHTLPYYEQNMLWFGAALYNKQLIPYLPES